MREDIYFLYQSSNYVEQYEFDSERDKNKLRGIEKNHVRYSQKRLMIILQSSYENLMIILWPS